MSERRAVRLHMLRDVRGRLRNAWHYATVRGDAARPVRGFRVRIVRGQMLAAWRTLLVALGLRRLYGNGSLLVPGDTLRKVRR